MRTAAATQELKQLEAEAGYARERLDLYRAKTYGPRPTNPNRLRKLEEASRYAEKRLTRAKSSA